MRENVNNLVSCANFFNMRGLKYSRNEFFEAYTVYLCVDIMAKTENDHFNSNKIIPCVKVATLV